MRATLRILTFALLVLPVVVAVVAESPQAATPQPADPQVTLQDFLAPAPSVDTEGACNAPESVNASAAFCPYGGPDCVEHDDCDDFCGGPEFGYCEKQGFFPTGCCLCLG